jgi:hypothetical protein
MAIGSIPQPVNDPIFPGLMIGTTSLFNPQGPLGGDRISNGISNLVVGTQPNPGSPSYFDLTNQANSQFMQSNQDLANQWQQSKYANKNDPNDLGSFMGYLSSVGKNMWDLPGYKDWQSASDQAMSAPGAPMAVTTGMGGGGLTMQQQPAPSNLVNPGIGVDLGNLNGPVQQLNSPSLEQIAQTPPPSTGPRMVNGQFVDSVFGHPLLPHELTADMRAQMAAYQPSVPMMTQPPETQQVVAQIQAPVTNMPTTPVPVPQAPPQTQQLLRQIAAPVMTRTAPRPQQPAMSMRAPTPVQTDRLAPIRQSLAQLRPLRTPQPAVQPRRPAPISRVQPRLLPTPPMGRR